jgi:predicted nuclease with TOPRIM domain
LIDWLCKILIKERPDMQQTLRETEEKLERVIVERDSLLIDKHFLQEVAKNQMTCVEELKRTNHQLNERIKWLTIYD